MLRLLNMIADFIITYKSAIITAVAAWVSYTLAVNASNIAFKAHYYWLVITQGAMKLLSTVTLALKIAFFAVTGQIERAKAAYTAFHLLTKSTPWGIIIAAITAVGVALYNMATQTKEATKAEKELQQMNEELAETRKRYQERLDVEKRRIMDLVAVARDDKASMEQRKKDEEQSLAAFLEQDKDMVMAQLSADRTQENAVRVLEKETDRLMYRAGAFDARKAPAAQGMLQVLKSALPLTATVSEVQTWEKSAKKDAGKGSVRPPALSVVCGIAGILCVIAGLIGPGTFSGFTRIFQVLWTAAGCALLLAGGYLAGRGRRMEGRQKTGPLFKKGFWLSV